MKLFCLFDGARFYANSSLIYMPKYSGRPVLVSQGQGIAIAANRVATDLGLLKFKPIWEQVDKLKSNDGAIIKCNFNTLGHISKRFISSLRDFFDKTSVSQYSVDEVFVELSKFDDMGVDIHTLVSDARRKVYRETGVAVGAAAGTTLTLAKAASWAAKNMAGMNGICVLKSEKEVDQVLANMPIGEVWGVGRKLAGYFKVSGLHTALDLKHADPIEYRKLYSVNVSNTIHELNSKSVLTLSTEPVPKQQIYSTKSYRDRLIDPKSILRELANHVGEVMYQLRSQDSRCKKLKIFVSTSRYDKCEMYYKDIELDVSFGLSDTVKALQLTSECFERLLPRSLIAQPIYKVGVGASEIVHLKFSQPDLFSHTDEREGLNQTLDYLNERFGRGTLSFASQSKGYNETRGDIDIVELEDYLTDKNSLLTVHCI